MLMYALGILPLIQKLNTDATQVWFADDGTAGGRLDQIRLLWSNLNTIGPEYGYYPNAERLFAGTGVNVTVEGKCYL